MTLDEHILDELTDHRRGIDTPTIKLAMQDRAHALTSDTMAALHRLGLAGKIAFVPAGRWKLARFCSPDASLSHGNGGQPEGKAAV